MSRSTRESAATRALIARIDARATGRMSVVSGGTEVTVHLLAGDVVAATIDEELLLAIRMLARQGAMGDAEAIRLETALDSGADVFEQLLRLGDPFDEVLRERFRQNVCDYLSSGGAPRFFEQKTILVQNIQIGHDTRALIDELCALCDQARAVDPDLVVVRGRVDTGGDRVALAAVRLLSVEPKTIAALIEDLPVERTRATALVGQWLSRGILASLFEEERTPEARPAPRLRADIELDTIEETLRAAPLHQKGAPPSTAFFEEDDTQTNQGENTPPPRPTSAERVRSPDPPRAPAPERAGWTQQVQSARPDPSALRRPSFGDHTVGGTPRPESRVAHPPAPPRPTASGPDYAAFDEDLEDARTEQVDLRTLQRPTPEPPPRLAPPGPRPEAPHGQRPSYANRAENVVDDELDAFRDNDYDRSSAASGRFTTDAHNLERVEVVSMGIEEQEDRVPARGRGPVERNTPHPRTDPAPSRAGYGAPALTSSEAVAKVGVANDVLGLIAEAFDEVFGIRRGQFMLQGLVDTAPSSYAPVLAQARISEIGQLPQHVLLRNLQNRPLAEHRLLLNNALVDLLERALSVAADELPEEAFERVLEASGGYRQRMGL